MNTSIQVTLNPVEGTGEYHAKFLEVLGKLLEEHRMHSTIRGQKAIALGKYILQNSTNNSCVRMVLLTCSKLTNILDERSASKTPKATIGNVWKNFHKLRFTTEIHHAWDDFLTMIKTPPCLQSEAELLHQLLLDRLLKSFISSKVNQEERLTTSSSHPSSLSVKEKNITRYIAGYVIRKLQDRYKGKSQDAKVQKKRESFLITLAKMQSDQQVEEVSSLANFTSEWMELVDRGGLYHVTDDGYRIMEAIEVKTKCYLEQAGKQQEAAIQQKIISSILNDQNILDQWDCLATMTPARNELLTDIIKLWTTVRCFAFAKNWNDKIVQEKFKRHGTRKTLK